MRRLSLIFTLLLLATILAGCDALEARYNATAAKAQAKSAEAYAQAQIARSQSETSQAIQATAQVAQVEATSRVMAFLATIATISQSNTTIIAAGLIAVGIFAAAWLAGREKR